MSLPVSLSHDVSQLLRETLSPSLNISGYTPASGGCINNGGKLSTSSGNLFIKWNDAFRFPEMFEAEAKGLRLLASSSVTSIPEVIATGKSGNHQFIILEYIEQRSRTSDYWEIFGRQLAQLHLYSNAMFGLDHDNYIGSLQQSNQQCSSWINFFIERRLKPQLHLGIKSGAIGTSLSHQFDTLFEKLSHLLHEEKPALLHGDLWSGNLMVNNKGLPCLIDPAVYFGNREADLAMTQLFGGFNSTFLETYHEVFPLEPDFEERFDLYNLYPLLVHVNLFGGGYAAQVQSIVKRFVS